MSTNSSTRRTANSNNLDPGIMDSVIKESSSKNREYFTAYLALLTYVLAIVFSTTDLQLLSVNEGINLPIAGINVPVTGFYIVMPLFVIALHFNFLQNLESHHYKLMCWKKSQLPSQIHRSQIQAFLFDYAEFESGSQFDFWVRFISKLLCLYLAPITLGLLLWRFTDRQEALITIGQYLMFLLDCWLVWKLSYAMRLNRCLRNIPIYPKRDWLHRLKVRGFFNLRLVKDNLCHWMFLVCIFLLLETLLTVGVTWLQSKEYIIYINSWAVPFIKKYPRTASLVLPYISITSNETVWKPDNNYFETRAKLEGEMDLNMFFKTQGQGFKPATLNLRLANLPGQYFPNAQLKGIHLEGAYLESVKLQGADLREAQLQAVNLQAAQLQGAKLIKAQLQDALLQEANLQAVNLWGAELQHSNLSNVQLQGAALIDTQLQGANLGGAQLQGALLIRTNFLGATLNGADLQGAILHKAELRVDSKPKKAKVFKIEPPVIFIWDQQKIEYLKDTLPLKIESLRDVLQRIHTSIDEKKDNKEFDSLLGNSDDEASKEIRKLCEDGSQSLAIQGIYNNYFNLTKDFQPLLNVNEDLELWDSVRNKRKPLVSIRKKLCKDSVCDNLKSKIDKLDCSLDL